MQKKQVVKMKVCVIGNSGVGKTHLINRLTQSDQEEIPTQEYQVSILSLDTKTALMEIQLWDCSGHYSQFHKFLRQAFFRNSSAALVIVDITDKNWEQHAHKWISQAYENQCYLVYAIAVNIEKFIQNRWDGDNGKSLSQPLLSQYFQDIKDRACRLFKQYEIMLHFLQRKQSIQKHFEDLFVRMHDQSLIVSRGSIARGMVTLPAIDEQSSTFQQIVQGMK